MPKRLCGLRNQSSSTPSSATRFRTPLAPIMEVFTAPERISTPTTTTKTWNSQPQQFGPGQVHGQSAEQIVDVLRRASSSGMIMPANSVITPVQITA